MCVCVFLGGSNAVVVICKRKRSEGGGVGSIMQNKLPGGVGENGIVECPRFIPSNS